MKTNLHQLIAALLVAFLAPCLVAQEDANLEKLAGTWTLDVDKTEELMDNSEEAERMRQMSEQMKMQMVFRTDGTMDMMQGENKMPGNPTFELTASDEDENTFSIEITREGNDDGEPMQGTVKFADDNTLHVTPDGQSTVVLVREVEVVDPEKAKEFFAGRWNANADETTKMIEGDDDIDMPDDGEIPDVYVVFNEDGSAELGEGERDPFDATYTVEAGDEDNQFVFTFGSEGGPQGLKITGTIIGKNRVKLRPEGEIPIIMDRAK